MTDQHAWVYRTVWFVASVAAIGPNRSMFENEGSALVAVTIHASGLRARAGLAEIAAHETGMGIMAGRAGHGAFGHLVMMRLHKRCGCRGVAAPAKLVDSGVALQTDK